MGEYESIEPQADKSDGMIISFKDRQVAESFFYGTRDLPGVGKLDFTWFNASAATNGHDSKSTAPAEGDRDGDVGMKGTEDDNLGADKGHAGIAGEVDYDVAEEDDRWI